MVWRAVGGLGLTWNKIYKFHTDLRLCIQGLSIPAFVVFLSPVGSCFLGSLLALPFLPRLFGTRCQEALRTVVLRLGLLAWSRSLAQS